MPISTPGRILLLLLPQTFLTPAYNVLRPTATLASDYDLTPPLILSIHLIPLGLSKHSPTIQPPTFLGT